MKHRYSGFTLIEVLIVVVIMAVLAATIIPQFTSSTDDAKKSARDFNTHSLRAQIELYRIDHNGDYPTVAQLAPGDTNVLTNMTDGDGVIGTDPDVNKYGPYILSNDNALPANPFNGKTEVVAGTGAGPGSDAAGWQYNVLTGGIWPNDTQYWEEHGEEGET